MSLLKSLEHVKTYGQLDEWINQNPAIGNRSVFARLIDTNYQTVVSWFRRPEQEIRRDHLLLIKDAVAKMTIEVVNAVLKTANSLDNHVTKTAHLNKFGVKFAAIGDLTNGRLLWADADFRTKDNEALLKEVTKEYIADQYAKAVFKEIFSREKPFLGHGRCTLFSYKKISNYVEPLDRDSQTIVIVLTDLSDFAFNALQVAVKSIKTHLQEQNPSVEFVPGSPHV